MVQTAERPSGKKRPQLAAIVTEYRKYSHAEHIIDRFLWGYGWNNRHHHPQMDVVSMYVDQTPERDLSPDRAAQFRSLKIYPSIAEALTLGGEKLAVDGVIIIGEHGEYPKNEKGQKLYPRYEFFQEVVKVFRDSGRSVPVFNDKHLSWNFEWAKEMVDISEELDFAFIAGSSLPVVPRIPSLEIPRTAEVEEVVTVGIGGIDSYDIHALEGMQSMIERRRGGETGVAAIQAFRGDEVWELFDRGSWEEGGFDLQLFESCLCRSHTLQQARQGVFNHAYPTREEMKVLAASDGSDVVAYRIEYKDGLKATMFLMEGLVLDMTVAARVKGRRNPLSVYFHVAPRELCNFFSPLCNVMERMFLTEKPTYPIERNLLTTGLSGAGVESLFQGGRRLETPHLAIAYQPTQESTFRRFE